MNAPAPEAENEYSKGPGASRGRGKGRLHGLWTARLTIPGAAVWAIAAAGVLGAALLAVAEFSPLYTLHVSSYGALPSSVATGSHNDYSLLPLALLAAGLAVVSARTGSRIACGALAALGIIALLIALIGDLPDTHAKGITHGLALASTTAAAGLYLETLGAVLLLGAGGAGLLGGGSSRGRQARPRRQGPASRERRPRLDGRPTGESES